MVTCPRSALVLGAVEIFNGIDCLFRPSCLNCPYNRLCVGSGRRCNGILRGHYGNVLARRNPRMIGTVHSSHEFVSCMMVYDQVDCVPPGCHSMTLPPSGAAFSYALRSEPNDKSHTLWVACVFMNWCYAGIAVIELPPLQAASLPGGFFITRKRSSNVAVTVRA